MGQSILILIVVVLLLVIAVAIWMVVSYNALNKDRNMVQEAWRQIDVELHRRYDLIPNLVETVKGYARQESSTLEAVAQARQLAEASGSSRAQQAVQEGQLTSAIGKVMAVAEAYPELRSNENFLQLQNELTSTEDRIASGRRYYNAVVRNYNTKLQAFPSSIIANSLHLGPADYFEIEDPMVRAAPAVDFGQGEGQGQGQGGQQA